MLTGMLGDGLVGLYLYGSLVAGDFDADVSDLDLLAVTDKPLNGDEFDRLDVAHAEIGACHPAWLDRIEIAYVSTAALDTFRTSRSPIAVISPGEQKLMADNPDVAEQLEEWASIKGDIKDLWSHMEEAVAVS